MGRSHSRLMKQFIALVVLSFILLPLSAQEQAPAPDALAKLVLSSFGSYDPASKKATVLYARVPQAERSRIEWAVPGAENSTIIESSIAAWFNWTSAGSKGILVLVGSTAPSLELMSPTIGVALSWFFCDSSYKTVLKHGKFFSSEGSYGQAPDFHKLTLGSKDDALLKSIGITRMGMVQTYNELAMLDSKGLSTVLSYIAYENNLGMIDEDNAHLAYEFESTITSDTKPSTGYPDILLTNTGSKMLDEFGYKETVVPNDLTERYTFSGGKYVLASTQRKALKEYKLPARILIENLTSINFAEPADSELSQPLAPIGWSNDGKFAIVSIEYSFDPRLPAPEIRLEIFDTKTKKKVHNSSFSIAILYNEGILDGGEEVDAFALAFDHSPFKKVLKQFGIVQYGYEPALPLAGLSNAKIEGFGFVAPDRKSALKLMPKSVFMPATDAEASTNYTSVGLEQVNF